MGARRKARECALQMLFQWDLGKLTPEQVKATYWQDRRVAASVRSFAEELFDGVIEDIREIDELIRRQSEHWRLERMATVDRNVLALAVHELRAYPDTPRAVVINEALEIARKFSSAESVEFINGVLDGVRKTLESKKKAANR